MTRFYLPLALLTLATVVWADGTDLMPVVEKVERFKQNRDLVKFLVEGGLNLAKQEGAVPRAKECGDMASRLAAEIQVAARHRDGYRAAELGTHLRALLARGVAANLMSAVPDVPHDSPGIQEMQRIGEQVSKATKPLEDPLLWLDNGATAPMFEAHGSVLAGHEEVKKVLSLLNKSPKPTADQ